MLPEEGRFGVNQHGLLLVLGTTSCMSKFKRLLGMVGTMPLLLSINSQGQEGIVGMLALGLDGVLVVLGSFEQAR